MKLTLQKATEVLKNRSKYASSTIQRAANYILEHRTSRNVQASLLTLAQKLASTDKVKEVSLTSKTKNSLLSKAKSKVKSFAISANRQRLIDAINPTNRPKKVFELMFGQYRKSGWFQYLYIFWLFIWFCLSAAFLSRILFIFEFFRLDYSYIIHLYKTANLKEYFTWIKDWNVIPKNPDAPLSGLYNTMSESDPISGEYHRNANQKDDEIRMYHNF